MVAALLAALVVTWLTRPPPVDSSTALNAPGGTAVSATAPATATPVGPGEPRVGVISAFPPRLSSGTTASDGPVRLVITSLGVSMPVRPMGVAGTGLMAMPSSPAVAGWYRFGAAPGGNGATVVAAHVDTRTYGPGPLARLTRMKPGERVELATASGTIDYTVEKVVRLDKSSIIPSSLFSVAGPPRLHLVTCGGAFDAATRHYEENIVVVAAQNT